jgi:acetolactate synthase-1/2/3 large subunit
MWAAQFIKTSSKHWITSAGLGTMGYGLPAAIGAQIAHPNSQVICISGDASIQMNIQELQTAKYLQLPITIVVANNAGYGIIKQFQDANTNSRYVATGNGYSVPDFGAISRAYGIAHSRVTRLSQLTAELLSPKLQVIELIIPEDAKVTPKAEGDHFLHDQFPFQMGRNPELPFKYPPKPSELGKKLT